MAARDSKRVLTAEAFGKFLRWLSNDDEQAVREYQLIRKKVVRYFIQKSCPDPDQMFDETVDIIVGKIDACADIASPLAYCFGVARNVWRQNLRENKSVVLEWDVPSPPQHDADEHERELQCLERCVGHLASNDRDVVTRYHQGQGLEKIKTRKLLADGVGGMNALRIRMCRIRKDLRRCIVDCLERRLNPKYSEVQE
jgi:DNA-directed RNA polymerase specialized sigma24 family protein